MLFLYNYLLCHFDSAQCLMPDALESLTMHVLKCKGFRKKSLSASWFVLFAKDHIYRRGIQLLHSDCGSWYRQNKKQICASFWRLRNVEIRKQHLPLLVMMINNVDSVSDVDFRWKRSISRLHDWPNALIYQFFEEGITYSFVVKASKNWWSQDRPLSWEKQSEV